MRTLRTAHPPGGVGGVGVAGGAGGVGVAGGVGGCGPGGDGKDTVVARMLEGRAKWR
eukprot:gene14021-8193_t